MILVTGAGSYLGRYVVQELERNKQDFVALYREWGQIPARNLRFPEERHACHGDLANEATYAALGTPSSVIHLAASPPRFQTSKIVHDNVTATDRLVEFASKVSITSFVFSSAISAYGHVPNGVRVTAETPSHRPSVYGASKLMAEDIVRSGSFRSTSLRLPGIVGPDSQHNWLSEVRNRLLRNQAVPVYNPDALFNNVVHVADLAKFLALHAHSNDHVAMYPIGTADEMTTLQVVTELKKKLKSTSEIVVDPRAASSFSIDPSEAIQSGFPCARMGDLLQRFAFEHSS